MSTTEALLKLLNLPKKKPIAPCPFSSDKTDTKEEKPNLKYVRVENLDRSILYFNKILISCKSTNLSVLPVEFEFKIFIILFYIERYLKDHIPSARDCNRLLSKNPKDKTASTYLQQFEQCKILTKNKNRQFSLHPEFIEKLQKNQFKINIMVKKQTKEIDLEFFLQGLIQKYKELKPLFQTKGLCPNLIKQLDSCSDIPQTPIVSIEKEESPKNGLLGKRKVEITYSQFGLAPRTFSWPKKIKYPDVNQTDRGLAEYSEEYGPVSFTSSQ